MDGVAGIRGAISMDWTEKLRPGADGQFYGGQFMWRRNEIVREFIVAAAAIAQSHTGAPGIRLFYDFLLTKEASETVQGDNIPVFRF